MSRDFAFASIRELAGDLKQRRVSSVEIVKAVLERAHRYEPLLNSFITLTPELAIQRAREMDVEMARGHYRGPLHGVPIAIKDHIDSAGVPTTAGAKSRKSNVPAKDAAVTRRMKEAGAVIIGKANMNKFASGESGENPDFGRIGNPWGKDFSPGGSSGGSGAHVAAGVVPLSIGSDNGGSVRIPAALCGVVGLKPTHGRVSQEGIHPRLYSLDHPGPLTRSVEDCAIALQVLAGHDVGDTTTARKPVPDYTKQLRLAINGIRVGVDPGYHTVGHTEVLAAFEAALDVLRQLGATVTDVSIPRYERLLAVGTTIAACEFAVAGANLYHDHPDDFDPVDVADFKAGSIVPAVDYIRATQERRLLQVAFRSATGSVDVFASPSYPLAPRPYGAYPRVQGREFTFADAIRYTFPFDVLGLPAISVPDGFTPTASPIGIQFVGRAFDEVTVLRVACAYEQATGWRERRPRLAD
jgi:aspartyl-tRNA(Asn)/glutamyl-tRNA(Gln) amidotransferase subunit A